VSVDPVVDIGPIAHGGHCVARLEGQVVFVRHTLPGERVRIRITERSKSFLRADAIEVLKAAPGRVEAPCPYAGPGLCGGCDFQHVDPATQRMLLADVVREQLRRLAGITWDGEVEAVEPEALEWRTRMQFAVDEQGRPGLRRHRSHDIIPVDRCLIAHPALPDVLGRTWDAESIESIVASTGDTLFVTDATIPDDVEAAVDGVVAVDGTVRGGRGWVVERVLAADFRVSGSGFWQVHPDAATTLVEAVVEAAEVAPGDIVLDLYAGVGLFTTFLADKTGEEGVVLSVESDHGASRDARHNLHDFPHVRLVATPVERALRDGSLGESADVVVLDPPRTGAKNAVAGIAALSPRRIVYVACDPAALARDLASFATLGYQLDGLRAFALFPMTHHVECVALLEKTGSDLR
jgi:tRNA/tmRNA/rRNA uracil-C5-methylase (TrmA/RlmC/RlmD family)